MRATSDCTNSQIKLKGLVYDTYTFDLDQYPALLRHTLARVLPGLVLVV